MLIQKNLINDIEKIKGKTIAIVYIYEGEDAPGFEHYHVWKSDVISKWLNAIQELHCLPFILDVRTFVEKAINKTLPLIDFVINLNCGSKELSPMGLVPSMCGFLNIPCIPCNTVAIITGENKKISNMLAKANNINVPNDLTPNKNGIYRPLNYGSSFGVKRVSAIDPSKQGIYQEFIEGYDITTPFLFNPITQTMDQLPTIIYLPQNSSNEWFFDETAKESKGGYKRAILAEIEESLVEKYRNLIKSLSINTYCRIDARIQCDELIDDPATYEISEKNTYFIEINPMPTVKDDNSFDFSYKAISDKYTLYSFISFMKEYYSIESTHGILLACSMLAHIITKY